MYDVVIPTVGRRSLLTVLTGLGSGEGRLPRNVIVVDDRAGNVPALELSSVPANIRERLVMVRTGGLGPAAARNAGALAGAEEWIAFLDDDVVPPPGWRAALARDLESASGAAASQGRVVVEGDDRDGFVKGLAAGVWITADMAYRRDAFLAAGGFDVRFPRAYREDADLGLRVVESGGSIAQGSRWVEHPVPPPAPWWKAVARQRGNADDALMLFLHGPGWQERAGAPHGARPRHLVTSGLLVAAVAARIAGRRRLSTALLAGTSAMVSWLAFERVRRDDVAGTLASSIAIPFAATWWYVSGLARAWALTRRPRVVLFDRDGTLVEDVPYNGDPSLVRVRPGARAALDRLRAAGIRVAMVTNQSGVARGLLTTDQVAAVNRRVEDLVGPFDATLVCEHGPADGCGCRKPEPGLVLAAARRLGVKPSDCAVVGDIESDVVAARRAGARGVLVPNDVTRREEVARAPEIAFSLQHAVTRLLGRTP